MPNISKATYFKASLEDKPGALLNIVQELKAKNIGLCGLWGYATHDGKGELYALPKDASKLKRLWKTKRILMEEGTCFWITGADRTGALVKHLEALAKAGVNLTATDAVGIGGKFASIIWVKPKDVKKAAKALGVS